MICDAAKSQVPALGYTVTLPSLASPGADRRDKPSI
jgi:hypothetical protein